MSIADVLAPVLATAPDREALVTRRVRWSYRQLDGAAARAAAVLRALGVGPGDRVAAVLPNEAEIVAAFHGTMRLGAVWVGINQALAPPEKAFVLGDSGASVLLCDTATAESLVPHRGGLGDLRDVAHADVWAEALAGASPLWDLPPVDPFAPAGLAYTSGTTGRPKGAIHSQHNLLVPGRVLVETRGYGPDLRKGDNLPLTILNLMVLTTLLVAQAGGTCVIMDQNYAQGVAEWIERERVTVWNGPPPIVHSLAADETIAASALASLREAWSGGSDLPAPLRARFQDKFTIPLIATYGLSEAPTVVSIEAPTGGGPPDASGRPLPHLDVFAAADDGTPLPAGEVGELCFRATDDGPFAGLYRLPLGYWNRPEESEATFGGGIVRTGDMASVDGEGFVRIVDRKKLVILRGGANVYPAEVERVLAGIDGVAASAVSGVADERLGERVVALVERAPGSSLTAEAIIGRCRAELAAYKVPERVQFVDSFPRNAMGKIDRVAVRAMADPLAT